jgi:tRNA G18 (ribose-2'-O)-methylase SpoU
MKEYYDENIGTIERTAKAFGLSLKDVFEGDKIGAHHPKMQQIYSNRNFDWMQEWYLGDKELKSIRDKIKRREKKMNASENPSQELLEEIATLNGAYNTERREFVNDMLELD